MGVIIDASLIAFDEAVSPNISLMSQKVVNLVNQLKEIVGINKGIKSAVEANYKSFNQDAVYGKFDEINSVYDSISSAISSNLTTILNDSSTLISMITTLKEYKKAVEEAEAALKKAEAIPVAHASDNSSQEEKDDAAEANKAREREISRCKTILEEKINLFNTYHEETLSFFSKLKGNDPAISFDTVAAPTISTPLEPGHSGSFTKARFNGMDYYVYIPEGAENIEGLPVTVFLHGDSNNPLGQGISKKIREGANYDGIIICPVRAKGDSLLNGGEQDTLIKLTDSIVEQYSADKSRISLIGYSNGSATGYRIVGRYPNYFSTFVGISSSISGLSQEQQAALKNTKIIHIHGDRDVAFGGFEQAQSTWNSMIAKHDADITPVIMEGFGHGGYENNILDHVFTNGIEINGERIDIMDYVQGEVNPHVSA